MVETILRTENLKKHFKVKEGFLHAVDGVNIDILKGQTLGVVGESGCGKSTLGRLALGLLNPTGGSVYYKNDDISKLKKRQMGEIRKEMQIIFQDPYSSLDPRMTVFNLISEPIIRNNVYKHKEDVAVRVFELMHTVGLAERFINTYPHEMDGGRRQRVGIARALALNPEFIVCDEPVSALDVSIQAQILNMLMDLQEKMGLTYMFITHDLSVVKHISSEIAVMYMGKCVEKSTSKELFKNPLHPYTKALFSAIPRAKISATHCTNIIRGEVSNPINPEPGCRFASRCNYCTERCLSKDIELANQGNRHYVACVLYE